MFGPSESKDIKTTLLMGILVVAFAAVLVGAGAGWLIFG